MVKVTYISTTGEKTTVEGKAGDSVMQTAVDHGIDGIVGECGGSMACATCHVFVDEAFLAATGEKSDSEEAMLEGAASDVRPNSRLSCQIRLSDALDGLVVQVAEEQM
ncbi:(2Fe-2S)-binding protein [Zhengella mangrovi]|uniref:(2Fe-2S)-binding protein n=1 Tax=Zhengella mangrovi TaxID=1982044 RepID=A0A2G1QSN3_9HYPH|nr:2Fe-2S iron-sulfur cluster-binding protein [Zhengella mangrovi]PHP68491.1 (2Fe-2S)-binding protein [Zhengella mangrovi]